MWKCPQCGEEIEDRFGSCWKCAKPDVPTDEPSPAAPKRRRGLFSIYWRRGWLVLLMNFCVGLSFVGARALLRAMGRGNSGIASVLTLAMLVLLLPALAYWIFVLFFGESAWPLRGADPGLSREEEAFALLQEASRLEARGKAQEALQKYQQVVERFAATDAGRDAQKSIESLRAKTRR
jgi:hypothetical protein